MNRKDKIKLSISRNWKFPGQERLSNILHPSPDLKKSFTNGIVWLNEEDLAIYTTADNYIEWNILSRGTYEPEIQKLIAICLKEGGTALDIGGNIGLQSLRMAQKVGPLGKIIAFEPLEYLRKKFQHNIHLNRFKNIQILPYALSDQKTILDFNIDEHSWNQGTFRLSQKETGNTSQRVEVHVADELPEIQQLDSLDLIKIDVEGFEFNVLRGLELTLKRLKPRLILEYDTNYWLSNNQDIKECYQFLSKLDYSVYHINSIGCELIQNPNNIAQGNLFCMPV